MVGAAFPTFLRKAQFYEQLVDFFNGSVTKLSDSLPTVWNEYFFISFRKQNKL
jgi:hypothetical protein